MGSRKIIFFTQRCLGEINSAERGPLSFFPEICPLVTMSGGVIVCKKCMKGF